VDAVWPARRAYAAPLAKRSPQALRALEELKMLSQAEVERERYEARLKAQLDHNSLMKAAFRYREAGLAEGLAKGEKIGIIHYCERLLKRPETPAEQ